MEPEKVIRDGKVAVLVSPGFGAGWSTWGDKKEFMLFDRHLVEMAERRASASEVEAFMNSVGIDYVYCGGWEDVEVVWLPEGTRFAVEEYDGSESLHTVDDLAYSA